MRWLVLVAGVVSLVGCTRDNPGFPADEDTGVGETSASTSAGPSTSVGSTSQGEGSGEEGESSTGAVTVTTTGPDDTSGSGTGSLMCPPFQEYPVLDVDLAWNGVEPYDPCQGPLLDIEGPVEVNGNVWTVTSCGQGFGMCQEGCDGESITIDFQMPPALDGLRPAFRPCAHVIIGFHEPNFQNECEFAGALILESFGDGFDMVPWFVAGSGTTEVVGPYQIPFSVDAAVQEACECVAMDPNCTCGEEPGMYKLHFEGFDMLHGVHENGGEDATLGQDYFALFDERSHVHEECGRLPHFDWIIRRQPGG